MKRHRITQARGPTIRFTGKAIADTSYPVPGGKLILVVYQTEGGAYVAVSAKDHADTGNQEFRATVVEQPFREDGRDTEFMQREVMDFFDWHNRARSMMRDAGWKLDWEVE